MFTVFTYPLPQSLLLEKLKKQKIERYARKNKHSVKKINPRILPLAKNMSKKMKST